MTDIRITRREFNRRAGAGVAAAALISTGPFVLSARGANERVTMGFIGVGGKGGHLIDVFKETRRADIAAVCDVYMPHLKSAREKTGGRAETYTDFRELLERKDLDAVAVATPDHWHAIPTVMACQAGLDVYVEKPLALTIGEGRKMVDAARAHQRVVQVGTQQRSGAHFQEAVKRVRDGELGKVTFCRAWYHENLWPKGIGNPPDENPPSDLDWDRWLGPAPMVPYNKNRCIYNFRWFWDYSGGKMTDWGTHLIDIIHWGMGVDAPTAVSAFGGKLALEDNRETPDTQTVVYQYPGFVLEFEHRAANTHVIDGRGYGMAFHGTEGTLVINRDRYMIYRGRGGEPEFTSEGSEMDQAHAHNFLDCIASRERPICDVEIGHRSTTAPHLGNIALRLGRSIHWDPVKEDFGDDAEANAMLMRAYRGEWTL